MVKRKRCRHKAFVCWQMNTGTLGEWCGYCGALRFVAPIWRNGHPSYRNERWRHPESKRRSAKGGRKW